jgi:hypothetical protein
MLPVSGSAKDKLLEQVHGLGIDAEHLGQAFNLYSKIFVAHRIFPNMVLTFRKIRYPTEKVRKLKEKKMGQAHGCSKPPK